MMTFKRGAATLAPEFDRLAGFGFCEIAWTGRTPADLPVLVDFAIVTC